MRFSNQEMLDIYKKMVLSRVYEELSIELLTQGRIQGGAWHLAIGQEAAQVGCITALGASDYYAPTFRNHGLLATAMDINKFTAECLCKETGYLGGKSAVVHIADLEEHILPANGILGAAMPIAVGFAVALKRQGKENVVVASIGDGASNEGNFYEAMNMAAIMNAPIVFFIENNGIGFTNPVENATKVEDLSAKGIAVGLSGVTVDGNDVLAVREAMEAAIKLARGGTPSIVEAKTVRIRPHAEGMSVETRDPKIIEEAQKNDPIDRYEKVLKDMDVLTDADIESIHKQARKESVDAFEFGLASAFPAPQTLYDLKYVYKTLGGNLE